MIKTIDVITSQAVISAQTQLIQAELQKASAIPNSPFIFACVPLHRQIDALACQYIYGTNELIIHNIYMKDRFELRQSSVRRTTLPQYNTGRSFISTAIVSDSVAFNDDLRKSRIQNLPNYKKTNLGENINFIVVFQTIEIERLSNQIELLRVKLKEAQRLLFNAQNYQVQIRQLTEKCFNSENQLEQYQNEYEKLNKVCQSLYHDNETLRNQLKEMDISIKQKYESEKQKNGELLQEIEKWKLRYQASEKSKAKEIEELRNLMDSQRKSMIDRQIRQMAIRFQNQRSSLENDIKKSREMLNNRNGQIEDLKQKIQRYQIEIMELRNNQDLITEYENKIAMLSNEIVRLSEVLRGRQDDIQAYKKREYDLNMKLKQQKEWENESKKLKSSLQGKNKQIEDWRVRAARLEEEVTRGKEMALYNNELTNKLDLAGKELDRLNNLLRSKLDEIDKWKQRYSQKQAELTQYKNLENDVAQSQSKINMMKAENDRISGILKSRLEEIQAWKKKNAELQNGLSKLSFLQKDKKALEDRFNNQIKNSEELKFTINKLETDNNALRKFEQRCRELEAKIENLGKQIERMNNIIRNKDQELNDNRTKFNKYQSTLNEFKNIQIHLKDYENKIALMTQQIDRLNNLIKTKNNDIEQLEKQKLQLHSLMNKYKNYEGQSKEFEQLIAKLQNNLQIAKKDIENWQNKYRTSETKIKELENNLYSNTQEKEKVNNIARNKSQECDELKKQIIYLQSQLKKAEGLEAICEQLHKQGQGYLNDLENLERKTKQFENSYNRQKNANIQLKNKLNSATAESERLSKEMRQAKNNEGKKSKEFIELQDVFSRLQTRSKSKDSEIEMLMTKISNLQTQCTNLKKEYVRLLEAVEQSYKESAALSQKIDEYQEYARRIHILSAEMDRLNQLNRGLEEDNKAIRLKYSNHMNIEKREQEFNLVTVLMAAEIQSLRSRIQQREVNLEEMRKSILEPIRKV